ncbi:DUF397 domain-containing protein [Streptomyces sp. NPDC001719]
MSTYDWKKSSYSGDSSNCLTIATTDSGLLLRESDNPEAVITLTATQLRTLIRIIKGEIH